MRKGRWLAFSAAWALWSFLAGALWVYPALLLHYAMTLSDWTPLPAWAGKWVSPVLSVAAGAIFLAFMMRTAARRFPVSSRSGVVAATLAGGVIFIALGIAVAVTLGLGSVRPVFV